MPNKRIPRPKKVHDIKKVQDIVPVVPAQGLSAMVDPLRFLGHFLAISCSQNLCQRNFSDFFLGVLWISDSG